MAVRRWGPEKGAGVVVVEEEAQQPIESASTGVCALIGPWERGEISTSASPKLNYCGTRGVLDKKMGGRISSSSCPDVAQDFFQHGQGAGEVIAVRLTDGAEETPYVDLFSRGWGSDYHVAPSLKDGQSQVKTPVLRVHAKNAGRWGGSRKGIQATYTIATDLEETTLDTGRTMVEDEWIGATLVLGGVEFKTYEVVSNTAAGVLHVRPDSTMVTDMGASAVNSFVLYLQDATLSTGARKGLSVRVREATVDPALNFGLDVYLDGAIAIKWDTLSMDPASKYYAPSLINQDAGNAFIQVETLIASGTSIVPDLRPANFYGKLRSLTATTAEFNSGQVVSIVDANAKIRVVRAWIDEADATLWPFVPAQRYVLTWDSVAHQYTIVGYSLRQPKNLTSLPAGYTVGTWAVGAAAQTNKKWNVAGSPYQIIVDHTAEPANGATVTIDFLPIENLLAPGGYIAPNKDRSLSRFRIRSATTSQVVVEAGDLTGGTADSTLAQVVGTVDGPFAIVAGVNDKALVAIDGYTAVTTTLTAGPARTAAQIVTDVNTAFDAVFGAGVLNPASASADGKRVIFSSPGYAGKGKYSTVAIQTVALDAYATLGVNVGTTAGVEGSAPAAADLVGAIAEPFAIVGAANDALTIAVDGRTAVAVVLTAGAAQTAQDVVDDINSAFAAVYGTDVQPASVYTSAAGAKYLRLTSPAPEGGGPGSSIALAVVANDAYNTLGLLKAAVALAPMVRGNAGKEAEILYGDAPGAGHDGGSLDDTDYLEALSISMSPLNRTAGKQKGVIQIACPGVTSTIVQQAGLEYGEGKNHTFVVQVPVTVTDDQDAVDYIDQTIGRSDFGLTYFPSYADVVDPDGEGALKTIPIVGMVLGRDALYARSNGGYHVPAAGEDCTLPRIVRLPTTGTDGEDRPLNEEILTPRGLNVIKRVKGNYVVWGARTIYRSPTWKWKNHRLQMSHYEHTLMENFGWVVFALNNPALWALLLTSFANYFRPEWKKGAILGAKPEDAYTVKIDQENNPSSEADAGNLNAEVGLQFPNPVERFVIRMSKLGLFENTSA